MSDKVLFTICLITGWLAVAAIIPTVGVLLLLNFGVGLAGIVAMAIFAVVWMFYIVCMNAQAAVLTITGSTVGHGLCNLTVEADVISANVSQAVNCSSWEIVAGDLA